MFVIIEPSQPKVRNVMKQFGHRGIPARTVTGRIAIGKVGGKRAWMMIMPHWLPVASINGSIVMIEISETRYCEHGLRFDDYCQLCEREIKIEEHKQEVWEEHKKDLDEAIRAQIKK